MKHILEQYGIILKPLTKDKIELIREWRNNPKISQFMEYRDYITPEMQLAWFERIDNNNNFYYIIEIDGKEIGLINIRDVDYEKGEAEPGIFIWDDSYLNSDISFRASIILYEFAFSELQLNKMIIHVLSDNPRAIKFNKVFGYKLSEGQEQIYNQEYTMIKDTFAATSRKIKRLLH